MTPQLLIFDLDGTLIDSRHDLAASVNAMRRHFGLSPLPVETVTGLIGDGVRSLVARALTGSRVNVDEAATIQMAHYRAHAAEATTLYPGVEHGLRRLHAAGHLLAVATNKPRDATELILTHFGIRPLFRAVRAGGGPEPFKPDPAMVLSLMAECGAEPRTTWVIGDNHTDLEAARRAGVRSVFAAYGFGTADAAGADFLAGAFSEIAEHFAPPRRAVRPSRYRIGGPDSQSNRISGVSNGRRSSSAGS
jgi:phosphoglycolate phosphatase